MRIILDEERVELVFGTLLDDYRHNRFPYDLEKARLPQEFVTARAKINPLDHANLLFCLCYYMRGGNVSTTCAQGLVKLHGRRQRLFIPELAATQAADSVQASLIGVGLSGLKNFVPDQWIENARRLDEWYAGDPRLIYSTASDWDEILLRVKNSSKRHRRTKEFTHRQGFIGFQDKMASMLAYYLIEAELIEPFNFPVPVDFHVMRICIATEIVRFENVAAPGDVLCDELQAILRKVSTDYTLKHGVDPIELTNALWLQSNVLCSQHFGNTSKVGKPNARATTITMPDPEWSARQVDRHDRLCGNCAVRKFCSWDVGNAYYTYRGQLIPIPRRAPSLAHRRRLRVSA